EIPNLDKVVSKLINRYPQVKSIILNINNKKTNVILGDKHKILYGEEFLIDQIHDLKFKISFYSFFQVNLKQTEKLYQKVLEFLKPKEGDVIIDGYCGVGTITLMVAQHCKHIYGIEVVSKAIENARENAKLNNINNVTFIVGKVEDEIDNLINKNISGIILDPPRKGVDKNVLEKIVDTNIPKVVYVSCNVASLARDLNILSSKYDVKKVVLVDMFCHTADVESVVLLERKKIN
ncbi:MAG TPA: 23S rRNA (uracil(1939)-C(5))-methyltransferase RlmD, partial [Acholeplasmataceae bacterium]|nr:23S rRNA (uracil(1939)-C(5))-methyltransferase RlmD [Acholeplasmataceae bacterium]